MVNMEGIQPRLRNYITMMEKAMAGDIVMSISNATINQEETESAWTRTVLVKLTDSVGNTHSWVNSSFASKLSIADTSSAGTATIASTTLTFTEGEAAVVITGSANKWITGETDTLTVANLSIMGATITGGTSVGTFVDSITPFRVTFSAGAHGTLTATANGVAISSGDRVASGSTVVFTATPSQYYDTDTWGGGATGNTGDTYTIASLSAAVNVTVTFKLETYVFTFSAGANGTLVVTDDGTPIVSGASVTAGSVVVFTATAGLNFDFDAWTGDLSEEVSNVVTIPSATEPITATATFKAE